MNDLDDYLAVGAFLLLIVPLIGAGSVWMLPVLIPTAIAFGIHKVIDLFITGKYQIVKKE
jgi:hypothetical protein